jgi:PAS domain S-box-containing protein
LQNKTRKFDCTIEPVIGENGFVQIVYIIFKESPLPPEEIESMVQRLQKLDYYKVISIRQDTGLILVSRNGSIIDCDEQFENMSGINKTNSKTNALEFFPSLNSEELEILFLQLDDRSTCELNTFLQSKTAERFPVHLTFYKSKEVKSDFLVLCNRIKLDSATIMHSGKVSKEIKEESREIKQPMCKIDSNGSILLTNKAFVSLLEFNDLELSMSNFFDFIVPDDINLIKNQIQSIEFAEKKSAQVRILTINSSIVEAMLIIEAADFVNSKPSTYKCYVTKPQQKDEKNSRSIYQSLFMASKEGIAVELDECITLANDSFAHIFGYDTAKELENRNILELVSEESINNILEFLKTKKSSGPSKERIEFLARKKDDSAFYAEFFTFEMQENEQIYLVLVAKDISERKRMREAAKDSEQKYRNIAENIDDMLYTFERSANKMLPTYYSSAIQKITGYTQTEFLSDQRLFLKIIHPDDFHDLKKRLSFIWKSEKQAASEFEFRIINKSGNIVWVRNKINVVRDSESKILKIYGLISDITFNKRAEEELKQSAANLKKLNDAKDRFLSIISHDLRAPFSSILGFTDLLLEDETLAEVERQQYISYIQDSSKSMLALVNSMLDWTRLQTGRIKFEPEKLNAREIIESSINTVSGTALKKGVEIENLVEPSLHIFGDKNLILQVFNNLLSNAVKFTKLGDRIMISVNVSSASRFITFSVKDTGVGIKHGNLNKLFSIETKYTSEGTDGEKGSGLGLSLVKEIIEKHGGQIEVRSEFGKGTEFIFTIPVASTKILLVDSNTRERMFYSKVLINITTDYAINVVSNGKEALDRIIQSPPALVITEHKMPIMSGLNLITELINNGLKDTVPVIVLTGEIDRAAIQEYTGLGIEYIFNKPVNLISLKTAIEKSLKKRSH